MTPHPFLSALLLSVLLKDSTVHVPPMAAWPIQDDFKNEALDLVGLITIGTGHKQLTVQWAYEDRLGNSVVHAENFDLPYWPTSATAFGDSGILIAGKSPSNGETLIERWDLFWSGLPDPKHPTSVRKRTLHSGDSADKREPRCMVAMAGADKVLLVFSLGDLYSIDLESGRLSLVHTARQVPKLALPSINMAFAAEHPTLGYTYVFECLHGESEDGGVLFHDIDKDGTIDRFEQVDLADWPTKVANVPWVRHF